MALTRPEIITLAQIAQETPTTVSDLADSLNFDADDEAYLRTEIVLWNDNHNDIDVTLKGETNYEAQLLLDGIRMRVRKFFGLTLISEEDPRFSTLQLVELEVGANFG